MDKQALTLIVVGAFGLVVGALLCGLMCLSAYHAH
jgi:hypothetical protein